MRQRRFGRNVPPHDRLPVAWYQINVLWTAARDVLSSLDQLRNRDYRDTYPQPMTVIDRSAGREGEDFWFDFIADTGDGGNATYAVASAVMQDSLTLAPDGGGAATTLPRGELLLLGGDLAYPGASSDEYRYRFVEMFEAVRNSAAPTRVRGRPFTLAAVAQNHDWMDSASTFSRYFLRASTSAPLLGADIPQRQSYFCVKLPGNWWALGLDFALLVDIDRNQFEQFEALLLPAGLRQDTADGGTVHRIGEHDNVLLVYPEPYWTRPLYDGADPGNPKRYQRLEGLLGDRVRLRLAGDLHHYMRWDNPAGGHLVTCGTGGAFTHPTHTRVTTDAIRLAQFDARERIPPEPGQQPAVAIGRVADDVKGHYPVRFDRQEKTVYPDVKTSRRRAWQNPGALLFRQHGAWGGNQTFALVLGLLYWLTAYVTATPFHESLQADGFGTLWHMPLTLAQYGLAAWLWLKAMIFGPMGMVLNVLVVAGCVVMGREAAVELATATGPFKRWIWTVLMGLLHGCLHAWAVFTIQFLLQIGVAAVLGMVPHAPVGPLRLVVHSLLVGIGMFGFGAVAGALLFGGYLAVMSRAGLLTNNGYSALGIQDFKGFLRFRIAADGRLEGHFVALDRVPRGWLLTGGEGQPIWSAATSAPAEAPTIRDRFTLRPGPLRSPALD